MPFAIPRLRLFTQSSLAAHMLESIKPALRALVSDSVGRVPDYAPLDEARAQVLGALSHAIDHAIAHVPGLQVTRGLLLVAARQIIERAAPNAGVAALKAYAIDQMTVRINSAQV